MSLPKEKLVTIDEFYKMKESTDKILEFIDGAIYMSPSPSIKHQRIFLQIISVPYKNRGSATDDGYLDKLCTEGRDEDD